MASFQKVQRAMGTLMIAESGPLRQVSRRSLDDLKGPGIQLQGNDLRRTIGEFERIFDLNIVYHQ
jgi:hypothetical protein